MSLNPLAPVADHQAMLNRIFWFTTVAGLVAVWILRLNIPPLERQLSQIDCAIAVGDNRLLPVPAGFMIPALVIGLLTRVYRIHARISDWLGIRESFDIDVIIAEFAARLSIDLSSLTRDQLVRRRHHIMRRAFYPSVSGLAPAIDPHLIRQALDAWSWFWIAIEATFVFTATSLALIATGTQQLGFELLGGTLLTAALGLPTLHRQCRIYAVAQVREILTSPTRANEIRNTFADLFPPQRTYRQAA